MGDPFEDLVLRIPCSRATLLGCSWAFMTTHATGFQALLVIMATYVRPVTGTIIKNCEPSCILLRPPQLQAGMTPVFRERWPELRLAAGPRGRSWASPGPAGSPPPGGFCGVQGELKGSLNGGQTVDDKTLASPTTEKPVYHH